MSRTVIKDDLSGERRADLVVFRAKDVPPLPSTALGRVKALLSEVTRYSSFTAYGSAERRSEYVQALESLVAEMERVVDQRGGRPEEP